MNRIRNMLRIFSYVTTAVTLGTAVYIMIFWGNITVSCQILWQILAVSFLTSLGSLLMPDAELGKKQLLAVNLLYYLYVNAVVLTAGTFFEWFYPGRIEMTVGMLLLIAAIYGSILLITYKREKRLAGILNRKLHEQNERKSS